MQRGLALALLSLLPLIACATTREQDLALRIEDLPAEGVLRIHNDSSDDAVLYLSAEPGFGDLEQALLVRYRDSAGELVTFNGTLADGWWTPLVMSSQAYGPGEWPNRRMLKIPAANFHDLRRDLAALVRWIRVDDLSVRGPCEAQLMFRAYPRPGSWSRVELVTGWQPADCPRQ